MHLQFGNTRMQFQGVHVQLDSVHMQLEGARVQLGSVLLQVGGVRLKLENIQSSTGSLAGLVVHERMQSGDTATESARDFADYRKGAFIVSS